MSEIIEYEIITSERMRFLVEEVALAIKDGWQPLGGVCYNRDSGYLMIAQAMVKYKPVEDQGDGR